MGKWKWWYLLSTGNHRKLGKSHPKSQTSFSLIIDNIALSISRLKNELGFFPSISELKRVLFVLLLLLFMKLFLLLQLRMIGNASHNSPEDRMRVLIEAVWAEYDPATTQMCPSLPLSFGCKPQIRITAFTGKKINASPAKKNHPFKNNESKKHNVTYNVTFKFLKGSHKRGSLHV